MTSTPLSREDHDAPAKPVNSTTRVATASFIGTAIEFYDFYVYATAAALVIGPVFFPQTSGTAQMLSSFLTFGIAFLARPLGSALFGHFGDRIGRKSTLVASLLLMGICTTLIGVLPGYATIGAWAPILLCVLRFGQGLGLGGEWGGAALLATENAPKGKRAWFGMFPQLGPSIGFLAANGLFLTLAMTLNDEQFRAWGWRIPFLLSAVLVMVGLYVRLKLEETPVFAKAMARHQRVSLPIVETFGQHWKPMLLGAASMVVLRTVLYLDGVFVELRRGHAGLYPGNVPGAVVLCGAVHGGGHTAGCIGERSLRAQAGVDCGWRAGDPVRFHHGATADPRQHLGCGAVSVHRIVSDGHHVRPDGRAATGAVPDTGSLYRRIGGLQPGRNRWGVGRPLLRPETGGDGWPELGGRVCVCSSADQRAGGVEPEGDAGQRAIALRSW